MEKCAADCKSGYNGLIPRTKHYFIAPRSRCQTDGKK
jgi:hypothetical protein